MVFPNRALPGEQQKPFVPPVLDKTKNVPEDIDERTERVFNLFAPKYTCTGLN